MKFVKLSVLLLAVGLISCSPKSFETTTFTPQETDRVVYHSHLMSLSTPQSTYTHIATIQPHILGGNMLQATGFEKDGNYAFVVYNTEGNVVRGGLDIIQLNSLNTPVVVSSIVSENSEYAEVKRKNNYLFMVGQKKTPERNYGLLTIVDVSNKVVPVVVSELVFTDGWYATSVDLEGDNLYITVPNVGVKEISVLNPLVPTVSSTKVVDGNSLYSRRHSGNSIVLGGTSTHKLSKLTSSSVSPLFTITNQEQEAPSRFTLKGNTVLTNSGYTGFKIIDNIHSTPVLKSSTTLTGRGNGITSGSCNMAYLAQGEEGLLTFNIQNLTAPSNLGRFDFAEDDEDCGSANNVYYMATGSDNYVFVADGLGGVKIVKVVYSASLCEPEYEEGLQCKVYDLSVPKPNQLPNFSTLTPVGSFTTNMLNVPAQTWNNSFPLFPNELKTMKEWYGIVCEGLWNSTKAQEITLSLGSDDGSKLYFNNNLEINNDGLHSPLTLTKKVNVLVQKYPVKIEYYQGPQTQIQLELKYQSLTDTLQYMTGFVH